MRGELFAYHLHAHKRYKPKQPVNLNNLTQSQVPSGHLLETVDAKICEGAEHPSPPENGPDSRDRYWLIDEAHTDSQDDCVRYGRIRVHRPAMRYDVLRPASQGGNVVPITDNDRERRPLFFWLCMVRESPNALLLTERHQRFAIVRSFWEEYILSVLRQKYEGVTFKLDPFVPQPVWEEYRRDGTGIKQLKLQGILAQEDESRTVDEQLTKREMGTVETTIKRHTNPAREAVARILENNDRVAAYNLVAGDRHNPINDLDAFDTAKLTVEIGGQERTVNLETGRYPQFGYPLHEFRDEPIALDAEGYPAISHVKEAAEALSLHIGSPIGIGT